MAIREELILETGRYHSELDEANRATIKHARKQEQAYQQVQKELRATETELGRLRAARDKANNPKVVRKYTKTIEKLEDQQRRLRQETQKYDDAVKKTSKQAESSFKRIGRSAKLWISGAAVGAFIALQSILRDMSGEMRRFDQKMNESLAIQGKVTMEQRRRMEQAAKEVAREMNIATDKVAEAYFFLASAGLDVEQQIANLPQVAEFAKAGMFDLATATDLATDAQSALGLTVENTAQNQRNLVRVTDVLTKANTLSNATIQQFSESLTNRAAAALRSVNKEVEEGVAVLAAFADQGLKGQRAGEQLSRILRITSQAAAENTEEFEKLGIIDAEGNLRSLADIVEALTNELEGLSDTQQAARLQQLGFTAEVQDSIKPILGMSDAIREYERGLRDAGGTTEEVAENQLKSLTERLGLLKRSFIETFGDDILWAMESTVKGLESIKRAIQGTRDEIEKESALSQAFEQSGLIDQADMPSAGFLDRFFGTGLDMGGARDELRQFYEEQSRITDEFNNQNREISKNIEQYSTWASSIENADEKVANANEELLFREHVLKQNIQQNEQLINSEDASAKKKAELILKNKALSKRLSSVQEEISQTRKYFDQQSEATQRLTADFEFMSRMLKGDLYTGFQTINKEVKNIPTAELQQIASVTGDIGRQLQNIDIPEIYTDAAIRNTRQYNELLTDLNNKLQAGMITQGEYEQRVEQATDKYLSALQEIYKKIEKDLTPAQKDLFKELFGGFEDAEDAAKDTTTTLEDLADTASAILNVADAFGAIDDQSRKALRGVVDVLNAAQRLQNLESGASFLDKAIPALGIGAGVASMLSGLFSDEKSKKEAIELRNSMKELRRAVERNTEAFYEQATVGSDISEEQIQQGREAVESLMAEGGGINWAEVAIGDHGSLEGGRDRLTELGEMFPDIFGEHLNMFNNLVQQGRFSEAIQLIYESSNAFEQMAESVGDYGDSIAGAVDVFRDQIEYAGATIEEAFNQAAEHLLNNVDELSSEAIDKIREAQQLDLSTEEGRERLKEIVQILFEKPQWRGDLSMDQWENMLDLLMDASEGGSTGGDSAIGSEASEWSRSVQAARTITDVQANEMVFLLEMIEQWTRDTAAALGSETAITVNETGRGLPSFDIPIPLPVTIQDGMPEGGSTSVTSKSSTTKTFNFNGPLNIGGSDITEQDIDRLVQEVGRELKRQIRGQKY